jgi:hypothetical protein
MIWLTVCIVECGPSRRSLYSCCNPGDCPTTPFLYNTYTHNSYWYLPHHLRYGSHVIIWLTVCIMKCGPSHRSLYSCCDSGDRHNRPFFYNTHTHDSYWYLPHHLRNDTHLMIWLTVCIVKCGPSRHSLCSCCNVGNARGKKNSSTKLAHTNPTAVSHATYVMIWLTVCSVECSLPLRSLRYTLTATLATTRKRPLVYNTYTHTHTSYCCVAHHSRDDLAHCLQCGVRPISPLLVLLLQI